MADATAEPPTDAATGPAPMTLGEFVEELGDRQPRHGLVEVGRNFRQRLEHEAALPESRVWDDKTRFIDGEIAKQDQVEVERAGSVLIWALATALALDGQEGVEEHPRRQIGLAHGRGVQEQRLRSGDANRSGLVVPRHFQLPDERVEAGNGVIEV